MAILDEDLILSRARLALDATAVGQAMLDCDFEEARFRAHLLHSDATDLGWRKVAAAALRVVALLPPGKPPEFGIGRALLNLSETLQVTA